MGCMTCIFGVLGTMARSFTVSANLTGIRHLYLPNVLLLVITALNNKGGTRRRRTYMGAESLTGMHSSILARLQLGLVGIQNY